MPMKTLITANGYGLATIPKATALDERLSYAARGLLLYILSQPEGWEANAAGLSQAARAARGEALGEGRQAMRALFAELEGAGYLRRTRRRLSSGEFFTELEVCDLPNAWDYSVLDEPPAPLPERGQGGVVYLIGERAGGIVKIGITSNLTSRLKQLQSSSPYELRVLWSFGGDAQLEAYLHQQFHDRRLRGEWFDFGDEDPIAAVVAETDLYYLVPSGTCASWS